MRDYKVSYEKALLALYEIKKKASTLYIKVHSAEPRVCVRLDEKTGFSLRYDHTNTPVTKSVFRDGDGWYIDKTRASMRKYIAFMNNIAPSGHEVLTTPFHADQSIVSRHFLFGASCR